VTRAEPGAGRTAGRLEQLGFEAVVAPLLAIRPLAPAEPDLAGVAALAFTSRNGVAAFAALTTRRDRPVFAVGDATAEAARAHGFETVTSAGGAMGDLAALLRDTGPAGRVLVPGAREPAGDLAALLAGSACEAVPLAVYEAIETGARAPGAYDAVLIQSPRAGRTLAATAPAGGLAGRVAVAISEAAAQPLSGLGFDEVRIATRPNEDAVLQALGNPPHLV
jgi:uroporphyrinogen-III synthase